VLEGNLKIGNRFRVITAMGPAYTGKITSMQVERASVKSAEAGQQVGIQIEGWNRARIGDLVEVFQPPATGSGGVWKPRSGIFRSK